MVNQLMIANQVPATALPGATLRTRRLRWFSIAALILSAVLIGISAVAVNLGLANLETSRGLVARSMIIQRQAAELQTSLRAAETGQRGYLLTGLERYLAPYRQAVIAIPQDYADLEQSVVNPDQLRRVRSLRPLIDAKLAELAETIRLRKQGLEPALRVVRTDVGQSLTEQIDTIFASIASHGQAILVERTAAQEANARSTAMAAAATGLLAVLSAILGIYLIYQQRSANQLVQYSLELERQVEERTARLSEANRELDAFAYTISHDLRAPLRAMHGYADALDEDEGERLSEEGRGFVKAITAAATRMNALIEDILTYARMAREELPLRPQALGFLVERARAEVLAASDQPADIVVKQPLGSVLAHGATLQQVIINLLSNAVKFVHRGADAKVQVSAERRGDRLRLYVEDNGIGVASEHRGQIFAPFSRLHGVESYPGTGIGLAIVRRGVERMGGSCGVEAAPGGGSRFWVELKAVNE